MIIANPIYDATFKRILENERVAKFLIGTILDCKVLTLEPSIQEYTQFNEKTQKLNLFRKDFAATIETEKEGKRRVIIEIQKSKVFADVYRFKDYLGNEYKKSKLPIISIYILGFNLSVNSPAFTSRPDCWDLMTKEKLDVNDMFVAQLTHRAYFVQTLRIESKFNTRLEKLLATFEQKNFIGDDQTTKRFTFKTDENEISEIKELLGILQYVAADEKTREELDLENRYLKELEWDFGEQNEKIEKQAKTIGEQANTIAEKDKTIEELQAEKIKTAQTLISFGMSVEQIAQATGLTPQQISEITPQMND
jgi:hypothetical protein